ncbi:hypothetical protein [Herpetosiphon geysericola]|uniref:Uncharacterized protein n=1 Tax=Herpetosiphon geysericola TaxID=70996 RepID=A0A0P6YD54_9CHLR|nr:hypothetical protein [Herpetosiphon geysericola]KPL79939.1 hypothetical protein SE18_25425 [Herpetosiphon geysericola]KPL80028.1 hypothetical protein SE18_25955 [Herpetosiphon geysericola]
MKESYGYLPLANLSELWDIHRFNLALLEKQAAQYGSAAVPLLTQNEIKNEQLILKELHAEFDRRGELPQPINPQKTVGRQLYQLILLEDEQRALLAHIAQAQRSLPRFERQPVTLLQVNEGPDYIHHPGFAKRKIPVYHGDLNALAREGLLVASRTRKGTPTYDITAHGFAYVDYMISLQSQS